MTARCVIHLISARITRAIDPRVVKCQKRPTCSASSRCFEARGCESTLPCNAEEGKDATLKRAKHEFFSFLRLHHKDHGLSILERFSVSFLLKIQILNVKRDLRLMKTNKIFSTKNVEKNTSVHSVSSKQIQKLRSYSDRLKDIVEGVFLIFPRDAFLDVSNGEKTQNA